MRTMLVLVVVLLLALPEMVMAKSGAVWRQQRVKVIDFTPPEWQAQIATAIAAFNEAMPSRAPRLTHTPMGERPCRAADRDKRKGAIVLCVSEGRDTAAHYDVIDGRHIDHAVVALNVVEAQAHRWHDWGWGIRNAVCHELMHALFDAPESNRLADYERTCLQGFLDAPGPLDAKFAKKVYRKHGEPKRHKRHHH